MDALYHCSPAPGLTVLRPSVTKYFDKPRQVCLTSSLPMALMYGVKHFEYTYGYTRDRQLYYEEYFPGALEEIYRGKAASLYCCAFREDMEATVIPNEYVTAIEVPVLEETPVPDVYEALLEQERLGALRIVRWADVPENRRAWIVQTARDTILEKGLLGKDTPFARYMREKYPAGWSMARRGGEEKI